VYATSGLYTRGCCPGCVGTTQPGQRPITTRVHKPEAAYTVWSPDDERYVARNMLSLQ